MALKGGKGVLENSNNVKVFSKEHAHIVNPDTGEPINALVKIVLEALGYNKAVMEMFLDERLCQH